MKNWDFKMAVHLYWMKKKKISKGRVIPDLIQLPKINF